MMDQNSKDHTGVQNDPSFVGTVQDSEGKRNGQEDKNLSSLDSKKQEMYDKDEPASQGKEEMHEKILDLKLPEHMNHLMKLFEQFEMNFRLFRNRHDEWTTSLEAISAMIEGSYNRNFKESHFRQFLTIVPGFFLHRWEMRKGRLALLIELPADAAMQMENEILAMQEKYVASDTHLSIFGALFSLHLLL